jgi:hypothetical protein
VGTLVYLLHCQIVGICIWLQTKIPHPFCIWLIKFAPVNSHPYTFVLCPVNGPSMWACTYRFHLVQTLSLSVCLLVRVESAQLWLDWTDLHTFLKVLAQLLKKDWSPDSVVTCQGKDSQHWVIYGAID